MMALPSCEPAAERVRASAVAIQGGYDDATDTAVVGIRIDGTGVTCTGSLVAPNLVLTAQHCVASVPTGPLDASTTFGALRPARALYVTTRATFSVRSADYHRVAEVLVPPGERRVFGEDIALVVLAAAVAPSEATPLALRLSTPPAADELYSAIGYGATSAFGTDNDRRRRLDDRAVRCVARGCYDGGGNPNEWVGDEGPCAGDSGGPALDSAGRVLGVMARGAVNCGNPMYTLLSPFRDWLVREAVRVALAAGSSPPDWASDGGASDGGVSDGATPDASLADAGASDAQVARVESGCHAAPSSATDLRSRWLFALTLAVTARAARRRRSLA